MRGAGTSGGDGDLGLGRGLGGDLGLDDGDPDDPDDPDDDVEPPRHVHLFDGAHPSGSRRPLFLGLAACVAVAAAVIGFVVLRKDDAPPASFSLAAAAANADRAERATYDLTVEGAGRRTVTATVVLDLATNAQQVTVAPAAAGAATGPSRLTAGGSSFVVDPDERAVYVDAAAFAATGLTFDVPYVRIDADQLGDRTHLDLATFTGSVGGNPFAVTDLLAGSEVDDAGTESIAGEEVQHFRTDLPTDAVLEANPDLAVLLRLGVTRPETVRYDVFVTERNEIRRITATAVTAGTTTASTVTFLQPGDDTVVIPGADQVIDLADVVGG